MKRIISTTTVILILLSVTLASRAQQPNSRSRTPRMSADDLSRSTASNPSSASRGNLERFAPGGLSMSLELPDAPQSLPVPIDKSEGFIERAEGYYCKDDRLQILIIHFLPSIQFRPT